MAVKYVKDFEFPSDKGFSGSAGQQMVRAYARGGAVKKAGGGAVSDKERTATVAQQERMTRAAQRAPEDTVRAVRSTAAKGAGAISDRERALLARNAKLGLKKGGCVSKRNPQKIGSQEPVIKKGLGGIVKKIGGCLLGGQGLGGLAFGVLGSQLMKKKDDDNGDGPQVRTAKDAYAAKGMNVG